MLTTYAVHAVFLFYTADDLSSYHHTLPWFHVLEKKNPEGEPVQESVAWCSLRPAWCNSLHFRAVNKMSFWKDKCTRSVSLIKIYIRKILKGKEVLAGNFDL